jgi:hypothetical protein
MRDASQNNSSEKDIAIMDVAPSAIDRFFQEHG